MDASTKSVFVSTVKSERTCAFPTTSRSVWGFNVLIPTRSLMASTWSVSVSTVKFEFTCKRPCTRASISSDDGVMVELVELLVVCAMTNSSTPSRYPMVTFVPVRSMMTPISEVVFPFPISMMASLIVVFSVLMVVSVPLTSRFPPITTSSCR